MCRETLALIVGREFKSVYIGITHVKVLNEVHIYEVTRAVVESIELDVKSFDPLGSTKGKLIGMHRFGSESECQLFPALGSEECHHELVGLAVEIRSIGKRLGVAELDVPFRLQVNQCHTR